MTAELLDGTPEATTIDDLVGRAESFCNASPHRLGEYAKRNWGGPLHSLCSYQGKLKPSIAHFLVARFTSPGNRVLDPLAGVGTIPLEARRQGRVGIASDLSPLADVVCRAKLEPVRERDVYVALSALELYLKEHVGDDLSAVDVRFGLNGSIEDYFHEVVTISLAASAKRWRRPATSSRPACFISSMATARMLSRGVHIQ